MTTAVDLYEAQLFVYDALIADPVSCLAMAAAWVDPLHHEYTELDWRGYDEEPVRRTWELAREHWPLLYCDMTQVMWSNTSYRDFYDWLEREVSIYLPGPVLDLEQMAYGAVPLQFYGVALYDEEGFWGGSRATFIADLFGLEPNEDNSQNNRIAYNAGVILSEAVEGRDEQQSALLKWMFSNSGNTLIDYSEYEAADMGIPALGWSEYEYAVEVQKEADAFFTTALDGLTALEDDDMLFAQFCNHVLFATYASIQERFYVSDPIDIPVPSGDANTHGSAQSTADYDARILSAWFNAHQAYAVGQDRIPCIAC